MYIDLFRVHSLDYFHPQLGYLVKEFIFHCDILYSIQSDSSPFSYLIHAIRKHPSRNPTQIDYFFPAGCRLYFLYPYFYRTPLS